MAYQKRDARRQRGSGGQAEEDEEEENARERRERLGRRRLEPASCPLPTHRIILVAGLTGKSDTVPCSAGGRSRAAGWASQLKTGLETGIKRDEEEEQNQTRLATVAIHRLLAPICLLGGKPLQARDGVLRLEESPYAGCLLSGSTVTYRQQQLQGLLC
ncbi:hypothetical protein TEQG_04200 [Trichophyton equinum CBS 127.97]|uniref:Uncharacterized protein n=1 Tax=Trichophyton equinum (strain ATCC MYA-4606 / CBS 127.97) TaxID=559882 RepID=F2PTV2_TRIEC|nr:hypothetical protein TEQG_04200 [Trichophyton equinum CBS 127.97]